jgi:hypothetical protein
MGIQENDDRVLIGVSKINKNGLCRLLIILNKTKLKVFTKY